MSEMIYQRTVFLNRMPKDGVFVAAPFEEFPLPAVGETVRVLICEHPAGNPYEAVVIAASQTNHRYRARIRPWPVK
jgi:5-deoxy-D-glucuronate isomerase